jgi:hypothetical protein
VSLIEKRARQPAILLAENNNNPAKAELARHGATFPASGGGSQAQWFLHMPGRFR